MFYQVQIETNEKIGKSGHNKNYFELDKIDLSEIEERIVEPYLRKEDFQFDGYFLKYSEIKRIAIKKTNKTVNDLSQYENDHMPVGIIMYISPSDILNYDKYTTDITTAVFDRAKQSLSTANGSKIKKPKPNVMDLSKIFVVHGRDDVAKLEAARFIEKIGLSAIILHEQASGGTTIIEKIENNTDVGFAMVLYTPCDVGGITGDTNQKSRARQNVVFEHGYLIAKLGRQNVCALVKGSIEIPTDISGIVYVPMDDHRAWWLAVAKELRNAGYAIDMNKII